MATLELTYTSLRREIGRFLSYDRDPTNWSTEETTDVTDVIDQGLRMFYWPEPLEPGQPRHAWSFLRPKATLVVAAETVTLPDDFGGMLSEGFTTASSDRVKLIPEADMRALRANEGGTGTPKYCALRARQQIAGNRSTYEVIFHPAPSASTTLTYRYAIEPNTIDTSNTKPMGGSIHSQTIIEACRLAALITLDPENEGRIQAQQQRFRQALLSSITTDQEITYANRDSYPITGETDGTYLWLKREVGGYLGFGWNRNSWSHDQDGRVDSIVQSGLKRFYFPPPLPQGEGSPPRPPHKWSFLCPKTTLPLSSGTQAYNLPADFSGILGEFNFSSGSSRDRIAIVPEPQLRHLTVSNPQNGVPTHAAVRPKSSDSSAAQVWEVLFYPTPNATFTLEYRYTVVPPAIDSTNAYPLGGKQHSETILAACFYEAVQRERMDDGGMAQARFFERLSASVDLDLQSLQPTEASIWPLDEAPDELSINRAYLKRLVGHGLGYGYHPQGWTYTQREEVHEVVRCGQRRFYYPEPLDGERYGHQWSFLKPITTLTTKATDNDYDLPDDFAMLDGSMTYSVAAGTFFQPIEEVGEHQVRYKQQQGVSSGRPTLVAIRPKGFDGDKGSRYEAILWPTPDAAYVITYRYSINPADMEDDSTLPYGGAPHAQTLIEACLAEVEMHQGKAGLHTEQFYRLLRGSVAQDRKVYSPETLGINQDNSDVLDGYFANYREYQNPVATYNGIAY